MKRLLAILAGTLLLGASVASAVGTLTVSTGANTPAAGPLKLNADNILVFQARVVASAQEAIDLKTVKLRLPGLGDVLIPDDVDLVRLYLDVDSSGTVTGADNDLGSQTAASIMTFSGTAIEAIRIPAYRRIYFLALVRTTATGGIGASAGRFLNVSMSTADVTGVGVSSTLGINSTGSAASNAFTFPTLTAALGANSPSAGSLTNGATDVPVMLVEIGALTEAVNVASVKITATGTATLGSEITYISLFLSDVNATKSTQIGTSQTASGTVTFSGITAGTVQPAAGGYAYVLVTVNTGTGVPGRTLTLKVDVDGDITGTGVTTSSSLLSQGTATSNTMLFPSTLLEINLGGKTPAAATKSINQDNVPVLQFALQGPTAGATVSDVKLACGGTASRPNDYVEIRLYQDVDNVGYLNGNSALLQTLNPFPSVDDTVRFSGLSLNVPASTTIYLLAVVKTSATGVSGKYLTLGIQNASAIVSDGTENLATPFTSNAVTFSGSMAVSTGYNPPAANSSVAVSSTVPVFQFKLTASNANVPVTQVVLTGAGTTTLTSEISSVALYTDLDSNGVVNGSDAQIGTSQSFSGSTVTFASISVLTVNVGTPRHLLAVANTSANGVSGHYFTLALNATSAFTIEGPGSKSLTPTPLTSNTMTFGGTLTIGTGDSPPAANASVGISSTVPVFQFKLTAAGGTIQVTQVVLTGGGDATLATETSQIRLYYDANSNGLIDDGAALSTASFSGGSTVTLGSFSHTINAGNANNFLAAVATSASGVKGHTFTLGIANATDVVSTGTESLAAPLTSNTMTFNGSLAVTAGDAPPAANSSVGISATIPVFQFKLTATGENVSVTQIVLTGSGSATLATEIASVSLYLDANNNGLIDDAAALKTAAFSGTTVILASISGLTVNAGNYANLLAAATTSANGVSGHTFALRLTATTDITTVTQTSLTPTPLTSNTMTFAQGVMTVSGTDISPASTTPGNTYELMRLDMTISGPAVQLNGIQVDNTKVPVVGTYAAADIAAVKIYRSASLTDLAGTGTMSGASGGSSTITFSSPDVLYQSAGTVDYFIVYQIATEPTANPLDKVGVRLADNSYIKLATGVGTVASFAAIQLGGEHSLPVEFASFTAEAVGQVVELVWATESETDNMQWIVERGAVNAGAEVSFAEIHRMDGAGSTPFRTDYEFFDRAAVPGVRYSYRLTDVSRYGVRRTHESVDIIAGANLTLSLGSAYPNPANPATVWTYSLPTEQAVRLAVYNMLGQQVRVLVNDRVAAGIHQVRWDTRDNAGRELASGVYVCVLETPTGRLLSRATILR